MSYKVIVASLKARTAIHVGSGEGSDTTDALIRRNTAGTPIIPGTAIAGVLRGLLTRLAPRLGASVCMVLLGSTESCDCPVCQLLGDVSPSDEADSKSAASRLLVFNARLTDSKPQTLIRDGVGINRVTGAAARAGRVKFDLETLPAGTTFKLRLELRGTDDEDEHLLAAGLSEWKMGRLWLGGRVARGLGAFDLKQVEFKTRELDTSDRLLAFLKADKPWEQANGHDNWLSSKVKPVKTFTPLGAVDEAARPHVARRWVRFEGTLQAEGPLLTHDATTSTLSGFDHAPLLLQLGDWQHPVLTGASLRGVLRSHAERIARTLATLEADGLNEFLQHCPACDPNARRPGKDTPDDRLPPLESCDSLLLFEGSKGGGVEIEAGDLCLACQLFGSPRRGSRLIVEDAPYQSNDQQAKPVLKMLDFLAVDRFTGGGADRFKFDALALWKPAFKLRLHLDNPEAWELGWLALVLRDLVEGWLRLGMGAAKGFGQIKLTGLKSTLGYLSPADITDLELEAQGQRNESLYSEVMFGLDQAQPWVEKFRKTKIKRSSDKLPGLKTDSYFGIVDHLYPKEVIP